MNVHPFNVENFIEPSGERYNPNLGIALGNITKKLNNCSTFFDNSTKLAVAIREALQLDSPTNASESEKTGKSTVLDWMKETVVKKGCVVSKGGFYGLAALSE